MNNVRRNKLRAIASELDMIREQVIELMEEEQEAFDNLPESLQGGERGAAMEAAIESLDEAVDDLETVVSAIESACA